MQLSDSIQNMERSREAEVRDKEVSTPERKSAEGRGASIPAEYNQRC